MIKISIIIPVYNVEKYLRRCLDSLINQTLQDIEIICIDDCSTDNSLNILQEYAERDKRIRVITSEQNSGAAVARNRGLEIAQGEYLGFVDSDDAVDKSYYEELYKKAKEKDYDIVKCRRKNINTDGSISESPLNLNIEKFGRYFFTYEWQTGIYRSDLVFKNHINFPPECVKAQDCVFLNKVVLKSKNIALINNVYYHYYKRNDSLNSAKIPLRNIVSALKSAEIQLEDLNISDVYEENKFNYIYLYLNRINSVLSLTLFQNDSYEAKKLCAEWLINNFHKCKDIELLSKEFLYQSLLPLIKKRKYERLSRQLNKYKNINDINELSFGFIIKLFYFLWKNRKKRIVFWGASLFLERLIKKYRISYKNIIGIIDKNSSRAGKKIGNYTIYPPKKLKDLKPDLVLFAIKNYNRLVFNEVKEFLEKSEYKTDLINIFML